MSENKKKILEMLAQNKISADEAYRLLNVIESGESGRESTGKTATAMKDKAKYLRVTVLPDAECEHSGDRRDLFDGSADMGHLYGARALKLYVSIRVQCGDAGISRRRSGPGSDCPDPGES